MAIMIVTLKLFVFGQIEDKEATDWKLNKRMYFKRVMLPEKKIIDSVGNLDSYVGEFTYESVSTSSCGQCFCIVH